MERVLDRLDRRFGRYAIPNLIAYVVGGMVVMWVLLSSRPDLASRMALDIGMVRRGQVWRLVTFLLLPSGSSYWPLLHIYVTWWIGSSLEQHWGAFRFNVDHFLAAGITICAACLAGPIHNRWLDYSLFLAFATRCPEVEILVFFIVPIRVKWLGILGAVTIAYFFAVGGMATRLAIAAAMSTYALFFAGHLRRTGSSQALIARQSLRRAEIRASAAPSLGQRTCALCGARETDGADIRVCSCEACGGQPRTLCLEHARKHS